MRRINIGQTALATLVLMLTSVASGQDAGFYYHPSLMGFPQSFGPGAKLVVARALGDAQQIEIHTPEGKVIVARRQKVEILNAPQGTPSTVNVVSGSNRNRLPVGQRVLLVYLEPTGGRVRLNIDEAVLMADGDVAAQAAVHTSAQRPAEGANFQERFFSSLLEAIPSHDFASMNEVTRMLPMPPGYDFRNQRGQRKFNDYLMQTCSAVRSQGGIFAVAFFARLSSWSFDEATQFLVEALLLHLNDARVEDILARGEHGASMTALRDTEFASYKPEGQARLLEAAQTARSDRAAALFAGLIDRPLKDETKVAYILLLKRQMPHLRERVCDDLARANDKRERIVSGRRHDETHEAWEARVAAMAELWLREYGLGG